MVECPKCAWQTPGGIAPTECPKCGGREFNISTGASGTMRFGGKATAKGLIARIGAAVRARVPTHAAAIHPHDWHLPESPLLDGPTFVLVTGSVAAWRVLRRLRPF